MPDTEQDFNVSQLRMQDARKLIGLAVENSSEETFDRIGQPFAYHVPQKVNDFVIGRYAEKFGEPTLTSDILLHGMKDAMRLILPILHMHGSLPKEIALKIAQHPDTIHAHAVAANQPQEHSTATIYGQPGVLFHLTQTRDAIATHPDIPLEEGRGCAVVHYDGETLSPDPLFKRFVVWAGELGVHAYFHHRDSEPEAPKLF